MDRPNIGERITSHYNRSGLKDFLLNALSAAGLDVAHLTPLDLAPADEFHLGGLDATKELAGQMDLRPGMRLLDVGCGIGGPARYFASENRCAVAGIDLTPDFVAAAAALTRMLHLDKLVAFAQASALELPFQAGTFDGGYMLHVGMNIADKLHAFSQVNRVLKRGGFFVIYDIVRTGAGDIAYPTPWAGGEETSFVSTLDDYRHALHHAGFTVRQERGRREFGIQFMERALKRVSLSAQPALGLHLIMGDAAPVMAGNVLQMMKDGVIEPAEIISRAG